MQPLIYDDHKNKGILLVLDFENGVGITVAMSDEVAQQMVNIIQNKINARI